MILSYNYNLSKKISEIESRLGSEVVSVKPKVTLPKVLYNLTGVIEKIGQNAIVFKARIPYLGDEGEPLQKSEQRKALVNSATKFTMLSLKNTGEENKKVIQETSISFTDLKVGDSVEIVSNRDISQDAEFEAVRIRIMPSSL